MREYRECSQCEKKSASPNPIWIGGQAFCWECAVARFNPETDADHIAEIRQIEREVGIT